MTAKYFLIIMVIFWTFFTVGMVFESHNRSNVEIQKLKTEKIRYQYKLDSLRKIDSINKENKQCIEK